MKVRANGISKNLMRGAFLTGVITATLGSSFLLTNAYAIEPVERTEPKIEVKVDSHDEGKEILADVAILHNETKTLTSEAERLNNDIVAEIEKLREERKLEQEREAQLEKQRIEDNFKTFIQESKTHRFVDYDVRTRTNLTGEQLEIALADTSLAGLGESFAKAEETYGVSAIAMMSLAAHESAWGNSRYAQERNNLFGYKAYDRNPDLAHHFATKDEAIQVVSNHLATNYLTEGAKYHNGYTFKAMNVRYASDQEWNSKITNVMNRLVAKMETNSIEVASAE